MVDKSHPGKKNIDPRSLVFMDEAEDRESIDLKNLSKDDVISIRTRNTVYTLKVLNPEKGRVMVNSNGQKVTEETNGTVIGTTLTGTGTMVKLQTIILGLRLCVFVEGKGELIFSATQEVLVNGSKILPLDKTARPI